MRATSVIAAVGPFGHRDTEETMMDVFWSALSTGPAALAPRPRRPRFSLGWLCLAVALAGCDGAPADEDAGDTTGPDASTADGGPERLDAAPADAATPDAAAADSAVDFPPVIAFPTAEGFGAQSVGGRGGRVVVVENLNDSGPGSLRAALSLTEPRIVVFAVAGTITLSDPIFVREANSFLTIAGQTAPGEGIQIVDHGIHIRDGAHDIVIRHLRVRPGLGDAPPPGPTALLRNGVVVWGNDGTVISNVILDHITVMWCSDDSVQFWGRVESATLQWSLVAEGVEASQREGSSSKAILIGGSGGREVTRVSLHHNLLADVGSRNPNLSSAALVDFRNNLVFNWNANNGISVGGNCNLWTSGTFSVTANFVGNHYIAGADATAADLAWLEGADTQLYTADNWGPYCLTGCDDDWDFRWTEARWEGDICSGVRTQRMASADTYRAAEPFDAPPIVMHPTGMLESIVLARAGADRPSRDSEDQRVIGEVRDRSGRTGMHGAYPTYESAEAPVDTDVDGMPDVWETPHGLSPSDPTDGPAVAANGYTNVENYLNELAGDAVP